MKNNIKYTLICTNLIAFISTGCGNSNKDLSLKYIDKKNQNSEVYIKNPDTSLEPDYIKQYDQYKTIIMDIENTNNPEQFKNIMEKIGGLSFQGKYVILKKTTLGPKYIVLQEKPSEEELNRLIERLEEKSNKNTKNAISENNNSAGISSATITMIGKNLKCPMRLYSNDDETKDYCNAKAFVELNYKIDMSGSKATLNNDSNTGRIVKSENGKYVMITVSPYEEGGTGWHLSDEIQQDINRIRWIDRRDFVGPFANKYNFWVKNNDSNSNISLIETFPQNTNPESTVTESRGITVGLSGGFNGGTATGHPYAVVNLGASVQITNNRNISYNTKEYTVENNSYNSNASWVWNAKISNRICDYLTSRTSNNCYFTKPLWDKSWTANKNKFSAINYKSFTPSFQAIYKAQSNNMGRSSFEIGTNVETGVLLGHVIPATLVSIFKIKEDTNILDNITQAFTIDWSSPYFASEQNIRLQNTSNIQNTKCIFADSRGKVSQEDCIDSRRQVWGYDNEEKQFKSRMRNGFCLVANEKDGLEINSCSMANNQKWFLSAQGFIQLTSDLSKAIGTDLNDQLKIVDITSDKVIKFEAYKTNL